MNSFSHFATQSLAGELLSREDAFAVLQTADEELSDLLHAAFTVREKFFWAKGQNLRLTKRSQRLMPGRLQLLFTVLHLQSSY